MSNRYGILTINLDTNVRGFKKIFYNPSMTLKGTLSNTIIYFPENIALTEKDLGNKQVGKHDKIKIFFSLNQLNRILRQKKDKKVSDDAAEQNIKLILNLLFSKDENLYLGNKSYVVINYELLTNVKDNVITLYKKNSSRSDSTTQISRTRQQDDVKLYNVGVSSKLIEGKSIGKVGVGCKIQQENIKRKWSVIKNITEHKIQTSVESALEVPSKSKSVKQIVIPDGYVDLNDWKIVRYNYEKDENDKIVKKGPVANQYYYVNIKNRKTQRNPPIPNTNIDAIRKIKEWDLPYVEKKGFPPRAPYGYERSQPQVSFAPMAEPVVPSAPMAEPMAEPVVPSAPILKPASGGSVKTRSIRRKYRRRTLKKKLQASDKDISRALKRKDMEQGNIAVFLASTAPKKYFSEKEINKLNKKL